jgi:hypothetical protein
MHSKSGKCHLLRNPIIPNGIVIVILALGLVFAIRQAIGHVTNNQAFQRQQSVGSAVHERRETSPTPVRFVTSPTIDSHPTFFFGTGDGSNGYYAERPLQEGPARVRD